MTLGLLKLHRHERQPHRSGLFLQVEQDALAVTLFVVLLSLIDVCGAFGEHGVDQARELMGDRGHGLAFVEPRTDAAEIGAQGGLAGAK